MSNDNIIERILNCKDNKCDNRVRFPYFCISCPKIKVKSEVSLHKVQEKFKK